MIVMGCYVETISTESMRDATKEELQSTHDYVESISAETGVNFYSVTANDFKHIPGENDAEYIRLLEQHIEIDEEVIAKAIKRIKELSKEIKNLSKS